MAALETEVNGLYQADFQRAWDGLLDDLQLVPLTSVSQAAQDLYVVTSPQSPIRTLLTGIVQQVTLPAPGGLISAVSGAFGRAGSVPPPASAIAAHYQPLIDLVGSGPGAPIDQALRSLTDVSSGGPKPTRLQTALRGFCGRQVVGDAGVRRPGASCVHLGTLHLDLGEVQR